MWRVIDIGGENYFMRVKHNKLSVEREGTLVAEIPFADIHSIVCHGNGLWYSDSFLKHCLENDIPLVFCDEKHLPTGMLMSYNSNIASAQRQEEQMSASRPRKKQAWKRIITAKLQAQRDVLLYYGKAERAAALDELSRNVLSGDTSNREAVGAKEYFEGLFGYEFIREDEDNDVNAFLNYTYTIIRSCVARGIMGAGLHPGLGVFHSNKTNPYALADDLMEPLRPLGDALAIETYQSSSVRHSLMPEVKKKLVAVTEMPVLFSDDVYGLSDAVSRYVYSYYSFLSGSGKDIEFPKFNKDWQKKNGARTL